MADFHSIGRISTVAGSGAAAELSHSALEVLRAVNRGPKTDPVLAKAANIGTLVKINVGDRWLFAAVTDLSVSNDNPEIIHAELNFVGEGVEISDGIISKFERGISLYPYPGDEVCATTQDDVSRIFATDSRHTLRIGRVHLTAETPASLYTDLLLGRHFAVLGSTGVGKSTFVTLLLSRLLEASPNGHIIVFDPHGEYSKPFDGHCVSLNVDNIRLPYWLMNLEEHLETFLTSDGSTREIDRDILAKCLLKVRQKNYLNIEVQRVTADSPIPYLLSDLLSALDMEMGRMEKTGNMSNYLNLRLKIEEMSKDPRYSFMFSHDLVNDIMGELMSLFLRVPANGKPITVIDISGLPSSIVNVVVSMISRVILDFLVWGRFDTKLPVLIVCEEAQRYLPRETGDRKLPVQVVFERIAKEGRKHGLALGLISQRPSDLSEAVLSQCGTLFVMRLTTEQDQRCIRSAAPEWSQGLIESVSALRNQECIVYGEAAPIPVRVQIDFLESPKRPQSDDPSFSTAWTKVATDRKYVDSTISRWRNQRVK